MANNQSTATAATADAIIDRAYAAAFNEAIKARTSDDVTIGVATKEFIAAWRRVADDRAARSGMSVDIGRRLSAVQEKLASASAVATATAMAIDGAPFDGEPLNASCGGPGEACLGVAQLINAIWDEVGEIEEEMRVPETGAGDSAQE